MANVGLAIMWGLIFTIVLHIAKSMERQGIEIFDQIRAKLKKDNSDTSTAGENTGDFKKPTIYLVGFGLNNIVFLFQWASGATAGEDGFPYFTSMFGVGLIALMLYSKYILKEDITKMEYIGAGVLIIGTLILGIDGITNPATGTLDKNAAFFIIIIWIFIALGAGIFAYKENKPAIVGVIFGLIAGGFGGLDSTLKALGLSGEVIPSDPIGWVIFLSSFLFGFMAMLMTQWGFAKKANASVLVPAYNTLYVVLPSLLASLTIPGYLTPLTVIGISLTVLGIILNRAFKKDSRIEIESTEANTEVKINQSE